MIVLLHQIILTLRLTKNSYFRAFGGNFIIAVVFVEKER